MNKEYITLEKKAELEAELKDLTTTKRKEIADALEYAKSLGDLSENAEYHQAREDQARLEDRIAEVEYILKNAEVAERHHAGVVEVGTVVKVKKSGSTKEIDYTLVGSEEADIAEGKISNESPLGGALMGKKAGDQVTIKTPKGEEVTYKLVAID
jgi:transcription elongation factor GreA